MKVRQKVSPLSVGLLIAAVTLAGCPLPFDYSGRGAGATHTTDPSSPKTTIGVIVSYSEEGGSTGTIANEGEYVSGRTTVLTLATETNNSIIYYTDDGSPLTNVNTAKKLTGSSGHITVTKTASVQVLDIHAVAIGPNMLPSQPCHARLSVSPFPLLTVTASPSSVTEDGGAAAFTITSSSPAISDITVRLVTGGTYEASDVTGLPAPGTPFDMTLPQSATSISIPITGNPDIDLDPDSVTLTILGSLAEPPAYTVGSPSVAQVIIQDNMTPVYTVTYDGNGATAGVPPADPAWYAAGAAVTVASAGALSRTFYSFGGWNTASNGSGTSYPAGATMVMGPANVVLFAVWIPLPTYTVTYSGNGSTSGSPPLDGNAYHAGESVAVQGPGTLAHSTGFFVGWNTNAGGTGTTYQPGGTFTMGGANVTLYAMWVTYSGTALTSIPQNVTTVTVPEGITDIGTVFRNHPNLVSVTLPSTLATVGVEPFMSCPNLTTFVSSSPRYQVQNGALVDTNGGGTLITVPAKLTGAFVIPPVTAIGLYAFDRCTLLTSITIPPTLTTISGNAFSGMDSPIAIFLPSTVTAIAAYAFTYSAFYSITVPATVATIGNGAFYGCTQLYHLYMENPTPVPLGTQAFSTLPIYVHVPSAQAVTDYQNNASWNIYGLTFQYP